MRVEGSDDFKRAARALVELGDKDLRKATLRGMRAGARPLGQSMVRGGGAAMPRRGGLSARVAASKVGISSALAGRNPRVTISLRTREGYRLKAMDEGHLRHPVFARAGAKRVWVRQSVTAGAFSRAFEAGAPLVRAQLTATVQQAISDAAGKV